MLVIRLFRVGKKHQPSYKIVVTDKRNPPAGGRFVEQVGTYNPITKQKTLKKDRVKYWLSVGAQPSDTVHNLLVGEGTVKAKKIDVHKKPKEKKKEPAAPETPAGKPAEGVPDTQAGKEEKPAAEAPPAEQEKGKQEKEKEPKKPAPEKSNEQKPEAKPKEPEKGK